MQEKMAAMNLILCKIFFMLQDVLTDFNKRLLKIIPIITIARKGCSDEFNPV